jgi:hypothetical protein
MRTSVRWCVLVLTLFGCLWWGAGNAWATGTPWIVGLQSASAGEAAAQGLPPAPSASAVCSGLVLGSIVITWTAVTHATTYTVYESTTSATSGFSAVASGVTGLTYTQGGLLGNYWFEVTATIGSNWQGPNSSATTERTITAILCT